MTTDTQYASVRRTADRAAVLAVLTDAFARDPLVRWLFPDPDSRARWQARFHADVLGHPAAEAYLTGQGEAAAVWLTLAAGQSPYGGSDGAGGRLGALGGALAARHPADVPHRYLACMGVRGARQGGGLGSALLRHGLAHTGTAAYLEASSPRSRELYRRHGFADLGSPVRLGDGPPLWPMWRPAP